RRDRCRARNETPVSKFETPFQNLNFSFHSRLRAAIALEIFASRDDMGRGRWNPAFAPFVVRDEYSLRTDFANDSEIALAVRIHHDDARSDRCVWRRRSIRRDGGVCVWVQVNISEERPDRP